MKVEVLGKERRKLRDQLKCSSNLTKEEENHEARLSPRVPWQGFPVRSGSHCG